MARIIPNEETFICFATTIADITSPTAAEVAGGVDVTGSCISLNASSQGNTVPTPAFDSLFETSTAGTSTATFTADFYRDDEDDTAWTTLPRATRGYFVISRFGGKGDGNMPIAADKCEVWPVMVTSRTMANMSSNTVQTFTATCAVIQEPSENSVVAS